MKIEELEEELKKYISGDRYKHSMSVMKLCGELANNYGANEEEAKKAGLMHDMAKKMSKEEKLEYVRKNNIQISFVEEKIPGVLHGKIAADICNKKYNFTQEMCEAIEYHTTGKTDMTLLQKIVFIADKTDETRKYIGVGSLRRLAFKDIDAAILKNIDHTIIDNIKNNKLLLEKSIETRNFILINKQK